MTTHATPCRPTESEHPGPNATLLPEAQTPGLFIRCLQTYWHSKIEGFRATTRAFRLLGPEPKDWAPLLRYILKGVRVGPDWEAAVFDPVVMELTSGRQHFGFIGLLRGVA